LVMWKDGSTNWVSLKDMKASHPIELAEYAINNKIDDQPAFKWWVPCTVKHTKRIMAKVKSKYWLTSHKFGIKIPKTVEEALELDRANGNTLWQDAIKKEMANVRVAFQLCENGKQDIPIGYQEIQCHMIFDVKMSENFRRKARFVAGGHTTQTPDVITYSSVVSRDSVRLCFLIAALNNLDVQSCDIQNAYLTANCREKIYTKAGPEFGDEAGEYMVIKRALYGLKSSGAAFRALLSETMWESGFRPTRGDPDVYIRPAMKENGEKYYEMILTYVDDILCISHKAKETLVEVIKQRFTIKNDAMESPEMFLGAQVSSRIILGKECWTMTSNKYINAAIQRVQETASKRGKIIGGRGNTPLPSDYRPEVDVTSELLPDMMREYQEFIGILRWAVELGRIDIHVEVSMLLSHLACPRSGHYDAALHVFSYLKKHPKRSIAFDPRYPKIDQNRFISHDWYDFYRGAEEPIPGDLPQPLGKPVTTHCYVDASHADNRANRRC